MISLIFSLFFLLGSMFLTLTASSLFLLGKFKVKETFKKRSSFFFRPLLKFFFPKSEWEYLNFTISVTKHIVLLSFAISAFFFLTDYFSPLKIHDFLIMGGVIVAVSLSCDFFARFLSYLWPHLFFRLSAPFSSIYLSLFFPLVGLFLQISRLALRKPLESPALLADKTKLREMIRESDLQQHLDATDQKLIASFITFKERVAKEIMVPRVDVYSLASETTIEEAGPLFAGEGYSRIPIYRESLDQIVGVVLYKDLLRCYVNPSQNMKASLDAIAKPVLYAPENKKITELLQEFRNKQIHMAIIVDEYGGTEGIVTIEDILEELVGEIEDEYDIGEEHDFWELPGGGWVVDAKMTIHEIEEQLGIKIPPNPEYETVGGYVYHCAGTIPAKGWRLSHDEFDLEVLSSTERSLKKIKIQPRKKPNL